jgi:type VI secretion system ImpM family protein
MSSVAVGFYGKLPSHGDFLRRRASDSFVTGWDAWLQAGMTASRSALGDAWLDTYLTSPVWRFACESGACGSTSVVGVLVPSIDRVGRYFPLTVVAELPVDVSVVTVATRGVPFFEAAERLLIETLAAETVNFERFWTPPRPRCCRAAPAAGSCRSTPPGSSRRCSNSCSRVTSAWSTGRWSCGGPKARPSSIRAA